MPKATKTLVAILLSCYAAVLSSQAWRIGVTFDEPSHLAAGYMYWLGQDVLHPSDTPPLMRILSGWIPHVMGVAVKRDTWTRETSFDIGSHMLQALDAPRARRFIFLSRLPFLIFPLLTVWLVWHWAGQLFGEGTALVLAVAAMLEPTLAGHGPLVKSDVAAAFGCLLFFYSAWRYWARPDLRLVVWLALSLLVAVLAKFNLLALVPVAVVLVWWRGPRRTGIAVVLAVLYVGILAGYQFQAGPIQHGDFALMRQEGFSRVEVAVARVLGRLPWPEQFIRGIRYISAANRNEGFPAYMLGRKIEYAAPWYFPLAWAVKYPIALQLLAVAGLAAVGFRLRRREAGAADAFVWGPPVLMLALALPSHIHIGFRHMLPAIPFTILGGGFALARWGPTLPGRAATAAALLWLAVAAARIHPHSLSYFNEWVGGPENGHRYLADSNLDWGQNLPELKRYLEEHRVAQVKLFYFGTDVPWRHLPSEKLEMLAAPWAPEWEREMRLEPAPGVYAISVNTMLGYFFRPLYRNYFAYFKARRPDARAGYSILIYHVR